jgi:LemA protein
VVEAYPDLKANRSYLDLQAQISEAEEQIQYARRYYNGTVRELNILVDSFPSNLVARQFGFAHMDYFEIELATQRQSPELPFR